MVSHVSRIELLIGGPTKFMKIKLAAVGIYKELRLADVALFIALKWHPNSIVDTYSEICYHKLFSITRTILSAHSILAKTTNFRNNL
jgi:hypothetical protein